MLMFKKVISLALVLVMMAGMIPYQVFATEAESAGAEETVPVLEMTQETTSEETIEIAAEETEAMTTELLEETEAAEVVAEEASASESGTLGANLSWTLDENGTLTVSGTGVMSSGTMPWADKKSSIKSITIGNGVTTIAAKAFSGCPYLTAVTIQGSITSIGSGAFAGCTALTEIKIPEGLTSIGQAAFFECSRLRTIELPVSLVSISEQAFDECTSLTDVYYNGKASEWTEITVASNNAYLMNATLHCSYVSQSGKCGDNLQWVLEEGVLTITGTDDMSDFNS